MVETYIWYSCAAMTAFGIASAILSLEFHAKMKSLGGLPRDLEAQVFDKEFAVYDPYSPSRRVAHRFLTLLPFVTMFTAFGTALFLLAAIQNGFLLTLGLVIVALATMNVEEAEEAYQNSKILVKALKAGDKMGLGDLRLLAMTKQILPRIIRYFSGLTALFGVMIVVLLYFLSPLFWVFSEYIAFVLRISGTAGAFGYTIACFIVALTFFFLQFLASLAKRRILNLQSDTKVVSVKD